jgi:signal transduction histidine kinase
VRPYLALIAATLPLAFLAGALWLSLGTPPPGPSGSGEALDALLAQFAAGTKPVATVRLAALLPAAEPDTLLDPAGMLPAFHALPFEEAAALARAVAACRFPPDRPLADRALVKAAEWHRFLCGDAPAPAAEWFARPPYLHPGGGSYVKRAHATARAPFREAGWIERHLAYAHASEWASFGAPADRARANVAALPPRALLAVRDREPVVLGPRAVFIARTRGARDDAVWDVFPREAVKEALASTPYRLGVSGRLTYWFDHSEARARHQRPRLLALTALVALAAAALGLAVSRVSAGLADARRRRFMLQTLTHELRTPLAGMTVALEALRDAYDALPERAQESFVRVCDGVARLDRVVQSSRRYLRADASRALVDLEPVRVESVNELIEGWLERLDDARVTLAPLAPDSAVTLDPHWTETCVTNLIDNALRHGKAPVRVTLARAGDRLAITVEDAGSPAFPDLAAMAAPFTRGPESTGTGLGLSIVSAIAEAMGGRLAYVPAPTRFTLELPVAR